MSPANKAGLLERLRTMANTLRNTWQDWEGDTPYMTTLRKSHQPTLRASTSTLPRRRWAVLMRGV